MGAYSLEILEHLEISVKDMEAAGKISYGSNVKEVLSQVAEGAVSCGMVYATDATTANVDVVEVADSTWYKTAQYPMAIVASTTSFEEITAFADFLQSQQGDDVFQAAGFALAK